MIQLEDIRNKRIGFSVLNWGLGHVTRCIPLIVRLQKQSNDLIIFCNEEQQTMFSQYVKGAVFVRHEGYPFHFRGKGRFKADLLLGAKTLIDFLKKEYRLVDGYITKYDLEYLISDQRFGFYSPKLPTVLITHQIKFPLKGLYKLINLLNSYQLSKFETIWVMDDPIHMFAGKLSRIGSLKRAIYIGCHSRFELGAKMKVKTRKGVLVINGPAAYTTLLINSFSDQIKSGEIESIVGPIFVQELLTERNIRTSFVSSQEMSEVDAVLRTSATIFGFFGYTTLMDCLELNCAYDLIPTPGQDEQQYLAKRHKKSL